MGNLKNGHIDTEKFVDWIYDTVLELDREAIQLGEQRDYEKAMRCYSKCELLGDMLDDMESGSADWYTNGSHENMTAEKLLEQVKEMITGAYHEGYADGREDSIN